MALTRDFLAGGIDPPADYGQGSLGPTQDLNQVFRDFVQEIRQEFNQVSRELAQSIRTTGRRQPTEEYRLRREELRQIQDEFWKAVNQNSNDVQSAVKQLPDQLQKQFNQFLTNYANKQQQAQTPSITPTQPAPQAPVQQQPSQQIDLKEIIQQLAVANKQTEKETRQIIIDQISRVLEGGMKEVAAKGDDKTAKAIEDLKQKLVLVFEGNESEFKKLPNHVQNILAQTIHQMDEHTKKVIDEIHAADKETRKPNISDINRQFNQDLRDDLRTLTNITRNQAKQEQRQDESYNVNFGRYSRFGPGGLADDIAGGQGLIGRTTPGLVSGISPELGLIVKVLQESRDDIRNVFRAVTSVPRAIHELGSRFTTGFTPLRKFFEPHSVEQQGFAKTLGSHISSSVGQGMGSSLVGGALGSGIVALIGKAIVGGLGVGVVGGLGTIIAKDFLKTWSDDPLIKKFLGKEGDKDSETTMQQKIGAGATKALSTILGVDAEKVAETVRETQKIVERLGLTTENFGKAVDATKLAGEKFIEGVKWFDNLTSVDLAGFSKAIKTLEEWTTIDLKKFSDVIANIDRWTAEIPKKMGITESHQGTTIGGGEQGVYFEPKPKEDRIWVDPPKKPTVIEPKDGAATVQPQSYQSTSPTALIQKASVTETKKPEEKQDKKESIFDNFRKGIFEGLGVADDSVLSKGAKSILGEMGLNKIDEFYKGMSKSLDKTKAIIDDTEGKNLIQKASLTDESAYRGGLIQPASHSFGGEQQGQVITKFDQMLAYEKRQTEILEFFFRVFTEGLKGGGGKDFGGATVQTAAATEGGLSEGFGQGFGGGRGGGLGSAGGGQGGSGGPGGGDGGYTAPEAPSGRSGPYDVPEPGTRWQNIERGRQAPGSLKAPLPTEKPPSGPSPEKFEKAPIPKGEDFFKFKQDEPLPQLKPPKPRSEIESPQGAPSPQEGPSTQAQQGIAPSQQAPKTQAQQTETRKSFDDVVLSKLPADQREGAKTLLSKIPQEDKQAMASGQMSVPQALDKLQAQGGFLGGVYRKTAEGLINQAGGAKAVEDAFAQNRALPEAGVSGAEGKVAGLGGGGFGGAPEAGKAEPLDSGGLPSGLGQGTAFTGGGRPEQSFPDISEMSKPSDFGGGATTQASQFPSQSLDEMGMPSPEKALPSQLQSSNLQEGFGPRQSEMSKETGFDTAGRIQANQGGISGSGGPLGSLISSGEGGYGSFNRGIAGDAGGRQMDFSKMTVGEIMQKQAGGPGSGRELFAVGKYQVIPNTMREAVQKGFISPDEKFTPAVQERLNRDFLIGDKRPQIRDYVTGKSDDKHAAQMAGAREFASVGVPGSNRSMYGGVGGNRASISSERFGAALDKERQQYAELRQSGMSEQEAWRALSGTSTDGTGTGNTGSQFARQDGGTRVAGDASSAFSTKGANIETMKTRTTEPGGVSQFLNPERERLPSGGDGMVSPVSGAVSSTGGTHYGASRSGGHRAHSGIDWQARDGSPVKSMTGGEVLFAGHRGGYGATVDVKGDDGIIRRYAAHGSVAEGLKAGDRVEKGQEIGTIGQRHLHYEEIHPTKDGKSNPVYQEFLNNKGGFTSTSHQRGTTDPLSREGSLGAAGVEKGSAVTAGKPLGIQPENVQTAKSSPRDIPQDSGMYSQQSMARGGGEALGEPVQARQAPAESLDKRAEAPATQSLDQKAETQAQQAPAGEALDQQSFGKGDEFTTGGDFGSEPEVSARQDDISESPRDMANLGGSEDSSFTPADQGQDTLMSEPMGMESGEDASVQKSSAGFEDEPLKGMESPDTTAEGLESEKAALSGVEKQVEADSERAEELASPKDSDTSEGSSGSSAGEHSFKSFTYGDVALTLHSGEGL